jgi:hypothetical protein
MLAGGGVNRGAILEDESYFEDADITAALENVGESARSETLAGLRNETQQRKDQLWS